MNNCWDRKLTADLEESSGEEPVVMEEIEIEDLAVDGICGVY